MNSISRVLTNRYVLIAVGGVVAIELALFGLIQAEVIIWERKVGIAVFTAIPLFLIAVIQLMYNGRLQRTDFLRNYAEEFFTNAELYSAFHELVYTYTDADYAEVCRLIAEKESQNEISASTPRPYFVEVLRSLGEASNTNRLFHPKYFQGSPEERRLDMLIGYFDLLGYHYSKGFLSMGDMAGSLGHYLNIMEKRQIVKDMRQIYKDAIENPDYVRANGQIQPFNFFEKLMRAVAQYNEVREEAVKREIHRDHHA